MARVRSKDTGPELIVRRLVHSMGYRYRLHDATLPGKPDIVMRQRKWVIFVHGCFWHRHEGCALARLPKSRLKFWEPKLAANRTRDIRNIQKLRRSGWHVMVVWECQLSKLDGLERRIRRHLDA